jgi:hypothetical protein
MCSQGSEGYCWYSIHVLYKNNKKTLSLTWRLYLSGGAMRLELKKRYVSICRQRKAKEIILIIAEINNAVRLTQKATFFLVLVIIWNAFTKHFF